MQRIIDLSSLWWELKTVGFLPRLHIPLIVWAAALGAGPMSRGKSGSLITEEQLRVMTGWIDRGFTAFERKGANDPVLVPPSGRPERSINVMQDPPVPHEQATSGCGLKFRKWGYAVLIRQGILGLHENETGTL
jgi:hypothetical protein